MLILKFGIIGDDKMSLGIFSMNYMEVMFTCDEIFKTICYLED